MIFRGTMNRLFLLIPVVGEEEYEVQDVAYLKQLGEIDSEGVLSLLRKIVRGMKLIAEEDFEVLYDERFFKQLFRRRLSEDQVQDMPQLEDLLVFFNDAVSIQQRGVGNAPLSVNGMQVSRGLVNAFVEGGMNGDALVNKDALFIQEQPIDVRVPDGKHFRLNPLPCEAADIYLWFVENRKPQRCLDSSYEKHGRKGRRGKGGAVISSMTYSELQLGAFLKRAVVAKKGLRELYFKDNTKDKIIIFWDENLESPSYHAMEVAADDAEEIQKIYKRGGRKLMERIEESSRLI